MNYRVLKTILAVTSAVGMIFDQYAYSIWIMLLLLSLQFDEVNNVTIELHTDSDKGA